MRALRNNALVFIDERREKRKHALECVSFFEELSNSNPSLNNKRERERASCLAFHSHPLEEDLLFARLLLLLVVARLMVVVLLFESKRCTRGRRRNPSFAR